MTKQTPSPEQTRAPAPKSVPIRSSLKAGAECERSPDVGRWLADHNVLSPFLGRR